MKKNTTFFYATLIGFVIAYIGILRLLTSSTFYASSERELPAGFPTSTGILVIWAFLFVLWGAGNYFVYRVQLRPRRARNIFLNTLILAVGIFIWNFLVFSAVNFSGALAVSIAVLLLAVVVWFMYLLIHRYGGYLFVPMVIWLLFVLYLSISLVAHN